MTITAQWSDADHSSIIRSDMPGASIPPVAGNRHYQELIELGVTIEEHVEPLLTPEEQRSMMPMLSARQFRLGLVSSGRTLSQVSSAIAAIPDATEREVAEIEWEYATTFRRDHPLVVSLSEALGFTPEEIDTLWEQAHAL